MPSFFSAARRRKSEANLRSARAPAPSAPEPPPSLPMTARLSAFGLDGVVASGAVPPQMERRRSRSATRVLEGARPDREVVQAGRSAAAPPRQLPPSASHEAKVAAASSRAPAAKTPSAAPHAPRVGANEHAALPRRDASFVSTTTASSGATSRSREPSGPDARGGRGVLASPTPPTSDGGHEPFGLAQYGSAAGGGSASLDEIAVSETPRTPEQVTMRPKGGAAGLQPSSSFWGLDGPTSPPSQRSASRVPQRRESLQHAMSAVAQSPPQAPRESSGGATPLATAYSSTPGSSYAPGRPLGLSPPFEPQATLPRVAAPSDLARSTSSRGTYSPLAAFYGTASPRASAGSSPALTGSATTVSPATLFARQLWNGSSGGDGSATTSGASDREDDAGLARAEKPAPALRSPVQLMQRPPPSSHHNDHVVRPSALVAATTSYRSVDSQATSHGVPALSAVRPPSPSAHASNRAPLQPDPSPRKAAIPSRAVRPATPPKSPERARKRSGATSETATSPPPRRSSLQQPSQARNADPSRSPRTQRSLQPVPHAAPPSPSTHSREGPSTPRATAPPGVSPSKRAFAATETTPRAAALAAAREREKKVKAVEGAPTLESPIAPLSPPSSDPSSPVELVEERPLRPRVEYAFAAHAVPILKALLGHLNYADLVSLRLVSRTIRRAVEVDGREVVLERFLGSQGYRSLAHRGKSGKADGFLPADSEITLDLRDLAAFRAALSVSPDEYAHLARAYTYDPARFPTSSLRLARATTRAWNRVVLRLRLQNVLAPSALAPASFPDLQRTAAPVYKSGRAASLRVWVPTRNGESWMSDSEVVECEREVWRSSGAWAQLRRGDVVANVAIPAFGNVGTLVFDGKFLRDLSFEFDVVGHLPAWLNMLEFSPSHFHNIVVASSSSPVFYLSLAPYVSAACETIALCKDRVGLSSPQGNYVVARYVYRAVLSVVAGQVIGDSGGAGGAGPGGIEVVHPDWAGQIVLETEGTTEAATLLLARVASVEPVPWRILREKSRPGKVWLRPVLASESA